MSTPVSGGETWCISSITLDGQAAPDESDASDASDPSDESDAWMRRTQVMKPMNQTPPTSTLAILQPAAAVLIKAHPNRLHCRGRYMQTAYSAITASAVTALYAKTTMKTSPAKNVRLRSCASRQKLRLRGQIGPLHLRPMCRDF